MATDIKRISAAADSDLAERAESAWDIATLFPLQGTWSEEDYLILPNRMLYEFISTRYLGTLLIAPIRVRLWRGKFREPDLVFMRSDHDQRRHESFWESADIVVEVVSPDDPRRDLVTKREEYARARIPEYWIVDPDAHRITVLRLEDETYMEYDQFGGGMRADSALLAGLKSMWTRYPPRGSNPNDGVAYRTLSAA